MDNIDKSDDQTDARPMTREEALAMRGACAIGDIPADTGPKHIDAATD